MRLLHGQARRSLDGLAERNRFAGFLKRILENKYYLDWLYTDVIVGFVKKPLADATYWFNQHVHRRRRQRRRPLRRSRPAVGCTTKIDQRCVDGAVNGDRHGRRGGGRRAPPIQTGRVQQYAALFFAAAALLAGVFVVAVGG